MKGKLIRTSTMTIIALFMISIFAAIPVITAQHPAESIYLIPENPVFNTSTSPIGTIFQEIVWINTVSTLSAWQVTINYNAAWLICINAGYVGAGGVILPPGTGIDEALAPGGGNIPLAPVFGPGFVTVGDALLGGSAPPTAPAGKRLMWADFQITAAPAPGGQFTSPLNINNVNTIVTDGVGNIIFPQPFDGTVTYNGLLPPNAHMGFDILTFHMTQYESLPKTFTKECIIKGLSAQWGLTSASFRVNYNVATTYPGLLAYVSFVADPFWGSVVVTPGADYLDVVATLPSGTPAGDVLVVTFTFSVTYQGSAPAVDTCQMTYTNVLLTGTLPPPNNVIGLDASDVEHDQVDGARGFGLPYLAVLPAAQTFGPGPVVGTTFTLNVDMKNLQSKAHLVGVQFTLSYDSNVFALVGISEGPYLPYFAALEPGSSGTFWTDFLSVGSVLYGEIILPNGTGYWNPPYPGAVLDPTTDPLANGTIATLTFQILKQIWPQTIVYHFDITDTIFVDENANPIANDVPQNAIVTITSNEPGAQIDLYTQYSWGFGGQGFNVPADMYWPQKQVILFANVSYNYWPTQQKLVGFEVNDPHGNVWAKLSAITNEYGIATTSFRLPWPCEDPTYYFGVWKVTATVDVACNIYNDTMKFKYDWQAHIFKVTVEPPACLNDMNFAHGDLVCVDIDYGSQALQVYPALIVATLFDNVNVPVAIAMGQTTVGGVQVWCNYANGTMKLCFYIPKFAVAGWATLRVDIFDKDPTEGGIPYYPEYVINNAIYITPTYNTLSVVNDAGAGPITLIMGDTLTMTAIATGGLAFEILPGPTMQYAYDFRVDGPQVLNGMATTLSYTFDSAIWGLGTHTIQAEAVDFLGNFVTTPTTIIVVP